MVSKNRMVRTKSSLLAIILLASSGLMVGLINLLSGYSGENGTLHPVRGQVLVNGEPVENVNVAFHPLKVSRSRTCPVGRTNDRGIYQLALSSGKLGAYEGEYWVTFVWPDPNLEFDECECSDPLIHDRFKGMYAAAEDSTYLVQITKEGASYNFSLWRPRSYDPIPSEHPRQ